MRSRTKTGEESNVARDDPSSSKEKGAKLRAVPEKLKSSTLEEGRGIKEFREGNLSARIE